MRLPDFIKTLLPTGRKAADSGYQVYGAVVAQARQAGFYGPGRVEDTIDGRFDMIVLHIFMLFDRLSGAGRERDLAQQVIDIFFADMDRSLREMGAGDMSVPKKIKKMAAAFNGRMSAYSEAAETGTREAFAAVIARNMFPDAADMPAMALRLADYVLEARRVLAARTVDDIEAGALGLPAPEPEPEGEHKGDREPA